MSYSFLSLGETPRTPRCRLGWQAAGKAQGQSCEKPGSGKHQNLSAEELISAEPSALLFHAMFDTETLTVVAASASCLAAVEFVLAKAFASVYPKLEAKAHEVSCLPVSRFCQIGILSALYYFLLCSGGSSRS